MKESTQASIYLAPAWIGFNTDERLDLIDGRDGARLSLTGTLRDAFLNGNFLQEPTAASMARLNPMMERLFSSLVAADPGPLNRSVLLRGSGWSRLFIELTGHCNERCEHCYANASPDVIESLEEEVVLRILSEAKDLGFNNVQLTGGDPLLSKACVPAARKARELGFDGIEVYTNGLALKGQLFQDLVDLNVTFAISLYGQDPLVHDAVTRVPGSHRRTVEAIARSTKAGMYVRVGIIDTGTTGFSLEATRQLAIDLGVAERSIASDVQREVGRGVFQQPEIAQSPKPPVLQPPPQPAPPQPAALSPRDLTDAFKGAAAVSYDGQVYPCIFSRDISLGSIHDSGLKAVLEQTSPVAADGESLFEAAMAWSDRLTCWKCRLRAAVLTEEAAI